MNEPITDPNQDDFEPAGPPTLRRRDALKGIVAAGVGSVLPTSLTGCATTGRPGRFTAAQPALIADENRRPGTRDWLLEKPAIDPATKYRCPWIEGYCSHTRVRAGERIRFHVSTNPPSPFVIDLFRMGYYGGHGGRHMMTLGPFPGAVQPDPPIGPKRDRTCRWEPCAEIRIPSDWPSGVYIGKLTAEREGYQSYLIFIVRDDRAADFLFQCSDTTWQAYNRWPSQFSLYDDGENKWYWGGNVEVGFDRPYGKYCQILDAPLSTGSGEWFLWEFPLAFWLEKEGLDVTYISNLDTHRDPAGLRRAHGFLSVGHDEYYTIEMFNQLKSAVADGLSIAFLSGNTCCGLVGLRPNPDGVPDRIMERLDRFGPGGPEETKRFPTMGALPHNGPNEADLIGARTTGEVTGGGDWMCAAPDHWIFEGTGMKKGDSIPGLVGWEWHGDPADIPGLAVVATGPTRDGDRVDTYTATVYPGPRGNFVFNASSCWWADGLGEPPGYVRPRRFVDPPGPEPRAQRITRNVLNRMRQTRMT